MNLIDTILKESLFYKESERVLGRTGLSVTAFGLGGQALLEIEGKEKEAVELINLALDYGTKYFDTAPMYGPSRYYLGKALGKRRKDIVLASKVREREYSKAKKELDESFKLLKTGYIDIVQLHGIQSEDDKKALTKDGSLKLLLEAKKAGKIGFIGVTGHHNPEILKDFMDAYDFDTILLPVNPTVPEFNWLIKEAKKKNMGVIGMKVMSRGILPIEVPFYKLIKYAISNSDVSIVGCSDKKDVINNILSSRDIVHPEDLKFDIPKDIKQKAMFFFKEEAKGPWPHTYQPDLPNFKY